MAEFGELIKTVGVPLAITMFISWKLWERLNKVEDYMKTTLLAALTSSTAEIAKLNERPCNQESADLELREDWDGKNRRRHPRAE